MSLKEKLYLAPTKKYKKYGKYPWELVVSVLLILFTTCQVVLMVQMMSTYSYSQVMIWNQLFLNSDVSGSDTEITNTYTVFYLDHLSKYISNLVEVSPTQRYYDLNSHTFDDYEYIWTDGFKKPPRLLVRYINEPNENRFPRDFDLTRLDLGPLSRSRIKEFMNIVDYFEISFSVKQRLSRDMPVADECYQWTINQMFDFSYRGSVDSYQDIKRTICDGYQCEV